MEVHRQSWWVTKFTSLGFIYSDDLTTKMREVAALGKDEHAAQHIIHR